VHVANTRSRCSCCLAAHLRMHCANAYGRYKPPCSVPSTLKPSGIKGHTDPLHLVRAKSSCALVSRRVGPAPFLHRSSVPSHLTAFLLPCAGPGASSSSRASPQPKEPTPSPLVNSCVIASPVSFHSTVTCPPRRELVLKTLSSGCAVSHGRSPSTPSYQPASHRPSPLVPRCVLYASPSCPGRRCARSAHHVGGNVGRPHTVLWIHIYLFIAPKIMKLVVLDS
jgi:hypothetical protein